MNSDNNGVENRRCILCAYQKMGTELTDERPLCGWCGGLKFHDILLSFVDILDEAINGATVIDCTDNELFSFVADLGVLGTQHPFLASMRHVLAVLVRQAAGAGEVEIEKLWSVAGLKHVHLMLSLLRELNLVTLKMEEVGGKKLLKSVVASPDSLLQKVRVSTETDPQLNRVSTFLLGYITLKAIDRSLSLIETNGKLHYGEGVTNLYPIDKNGRIMITKGYTAPISFVFGSWAYGRNEFTDIDLHRFLASRGLMGREFRRVLDWFTSAQPGSVHQLFSFETIDTGGMPMLKFGYNPDYQKMRERVLERARERSRERGSSSN